MTVLAIFAITLVLAGVTFEPFQPGLFVLCLYYGGASPFNLAMMAGVLADLIFRASREGEKGTGGHRADEVTSSKR